MESKFRNVKYSLLKLIFLMSLAVILCIGIGCGENVDNGRVISADTDAEINDTDDNFSSGPSGKVDITPWMTPLLLKKSK